MTKKDFIIVAEAIRTARLDLERQDNTLKNPLEKTATSRAFTNATYQLIKAFQKDNARFDKKRFLEAVYK